jgi:uncharacterized protein YbaP (TraB family)
MKIKALFFAVGAAHLGGTRLCLLRKKGYTVKPELISF